MQGGVGTAGSANVGKIRKCLKYTRFGSAYDRRGRGKYADPSSMFRATVMLLSHIGRDKEADRLEKALDFPACTKTRSILSPAERPVLPAASLREYVMQTLTDL